MLKQGIVASIVIGLAGCAAAPETPPCSGVTELLSQLITKVTGKQADELIAVFTGWNVYEHAEFAPYDALDSVLVTVKGGPGR